MNNDPKTVADILALTPMHAWTAEQWAEHDKRIAAERGRQAPIVEVHAQPVNLRELGWPARLLQIAHAADRTQPGVARVLANDFAKANVIILSGAPGCGKSVAAAVWATERRRPVSFLRASTFAASSRYSAEDRAAWYSAKALVLDDLGSEYLDAKGSFLVDLDELVDTYYADLRPLVITTNCTREQFVERYGQRIDDRLRECATWFSIASPSLRRKP
jgi:DNA replication protein DnaC